MLTQFYKKGAHFFLRLLAFSPNLITSVRVWVDEHPLPRATPVGGGPLYVSPWQPEKYSAGLHTIKVTVKVSCLQSTVQTEQLEPILTYLLQDSSDQECNVTQLFSLDGTAPPLPLLPEMLLLTDLRSLVSHLLNFDLCPSTLSIGVCVLQLQMVFLFMWLSLLGFLILGWLDNREETNSVCVWLQHKLPHPLTHQGSPPTYTC